MIVPGLAALHVAAVMVWLGAACAAEASFAWGDRRFAEKALYRAALPGLAATALTGLALVGLNPDYYLGQGWLIVKIVLSLVPAMTTLAVFDAQRGSKKARPRFYGAAMWLTAGSSFLVVLLAFVRPF